MFHKFSVAAQYPIVRRLTHTSNERRANCGAIMLHSIVLYYNFHVEKKSPFSLPCFHHSGWKPFLHLYHLFLSWDTCRVVLAKVSVCREWSETFLSSTFNGIILWYVLRLFIVCESILFQCLWKFEVRSLTQKFCKISVEWFDTMYEIWIYLVISREINFRNG